MCLHGQSTCTWKDCEHVHARSHRDRPSNYQEEYANFTSGQGEHQANTFHWRCSRIRSLRPSFTNFKWLIFVKKWKNTTTHRHHTCTEQRRQVLAPCIYLAITRSETQGITPLRVPEKLGKDALDTWTHQEILDLHYMWISGRAVDRTYVRIFALAVSLSLGWFRAFTCLLFVLHASGVGFRLCRRDNQDSH